MCGYVNIIMLITPLQAKLCTVLVNFELNPHECVIPRTSTITLLATSLNAVIFNLDGLQVPVETLPWRARLQLDCAIHLVHVIRFLTHSLVQAPKLTSLPTHQEMLPPASSITEMILINWWNKSKFVTSVPLSVFQFRLFSSGQGVCLRD
jgi:hypothetical protein